MRRTISYLQLFRICLRLTLVFMWNSELPKGLICAFQEFLASIKEAFILAGARGAGRWAITLWGMEFGRFPDIKFLLCVWAQWSAQRRKCKVVWQLVKQLIYTMLISNNWALFHLWWKKTLSLESESFESVKKKLEARCPVMLTIFRKNARSWIMIDWGLNKPL